MNKINRMKKRMILLVMVLLFLIVPTIVSSANVDSQVFEKLNDEQEVSVIVMLKDKSISSKGLSALGKPEKVQALEQKKAMIKEQQDKVLSKLNLKDKAGNFIQSTDAKGLFLTSSSNIDFNLRHKYSTVNGFSGMVTEQGLEKLMNDSNVKNVYLSSLKHTLLDVSVPQINGDDVWKLKLNNMNITGKDETICVIDTGIDTDHSAFTGRILAQYCYCNITDYGSGGCCPNNKAEDTNAEDDYGHGTHCAGIAAGNHSIYKGVAPEADIISIKVCNSTGFCDDGDVIAGIDWCVNNATTYNISVISISLGGGGPYNDYCNGDAIAPAINSAVGQNISVIVASGNNAWTNGISSPACVQNATPIGSVDDGSGGTTADDISSFTNRGNILNLMAPGRWITAPYNDGGIYTWSGTSMSTPHVAGAAALLKQFVRLYNGTDITPQEIEDVLNDTGTEIDDTINSGRNYSRIDVYAAVMSLDTTAPQYSDVGKNDSTINVDDVVKFYANWSDSVGLSHYIFSWNNSGSWVNDSAIALTDWSNKSKTITATGKPTVGWIIYANDSAGNWNNTGIQTFTVNNTAPTITNNVTSPAIVYTNTDWKINLTIIDMDDDTLTAYVQFYVNNTANGSVQSQTAANGTNTLISTLGSGNFSKDYSLIAEFWAGDGTDNTTKENTTQVTVQNFVPTQPSLTHPGNQSIETSVNVIINWTASTDADNDTINYSIYFLNTSPPTYNSSTQDLYKAFTNLTDNETYYWYIIANDGTENSTASETRQFKVNTTAPTLTITTLNNTVSNILTTIEGTASNTNPDSVYSNNTAWIWNETYTSWKFTNNTNIADGTYHILITANDSVGNTKSSLFVFIYDTTAPTVTVSSSAGTSTTASSTTISGNATDSGSGIVNVTVNGNNATLNTSTGAYSLSVSLSVGSNPITVIAYDQAGNNVTNTSVTVTRTSSSTGGGGGTPTVTYEQKTLGILAAGSTKAVTFTKSATLAVTEITVTVKNKVTNAKIKVDVGSLPSGASAPSSAQGSVYKYITITKTAMTDNDVSKGIIKFKVKKEWLTDKGYGKDTVALHRYYGNKWNKLTTTRDSEDTTYYYYSAESPGFSTFAITAEKAPAIKPTGKITEEEVTPKKPEEEAPVEGAEVTEEAPAEEEELEEEKETTSNKVLIIILITAIIVFVIVSYSIQEKKQNKKKEYKKEKKKKHKTKRR